jgi:metal-responsive CopG/Arc/MetJ family transcriptional regulator
MTDFEGKTKISVWLQDTTIDAINDLYRKENCRRKSEFIEQAIMFYIGFISSNYNPTYLPTIITSTIKSIVRDSNKQLERVVFKLAVELAMTMNIVASDRNLSESFLRELRKNCREEVKEVHGDFTFNDAYDWQNNR